MLAEEFRACLDRVPPVPFADVAAVVTDEFGAPPGRLFARFDPEPLAAASIAQVHAAELPDGSDVVVKVQRPGLEPRLAADVAVLRRPLSEISYGELLVDVVRIGTRYQVRFPRELVLVAKQLVYFERYGKLMAPDWAILNDPELIGFLFRSLTDP